MVIQCGYSSTTSALKHRTVPEMSSAKVCRAKVVGKLRGCRGLLKALFKFAEENRRAKSAWHPSPLNPVAGGGTHLCVPAS